MGIPADAGLPTIGPAPLTVAADETSVISHGTDKGLKVVVGVAGRSAGAGALPGKVIMGRMRMRPKMGLPTTRLPLEPKVEKVTRLFHRRKDLDLVAMIDV